MQQSGPARLYDERLVLAIDERMRVGEAFGRQLTLLPVPDVEGGGVLDPRILPMVERRQRAAQGTPRGQLSLRAMRRRVSGPAHELHAGPISCDERLIEVGGTHFIDLFVFKAESCAPGCPVLIYLHGGNFNAGDVEGYGARMALISELAGAVVVFPEYRLAPECPFPAPIEDCAASVAWAAAHAGEWGADPARLMLAGDSAGGSLACACAQLSCRELIKRLFLIYPAVDCGDWATQSHYEWSYELYDVAPEQAELVRGCIDGLKDLFDAEAAGRMNLYMQRNGSVRDPLMSACFAADEVLARFPPTTVVTAGYDFMRVAAEWFSSKLASLGVESEAIRYEGLEHGFFGMLGILPQAEHLSRLLARELAGL